jgi:hypothetical protein
MKKRVKLIIASVLCLVTISGIISVTGYHIVIPISAKGGDLLPSFKVKSGDTVAVFSKFDFTKDNWIAYTVINTQDFEDLNPLLPKRTCLKTTDRAVLLQMQKSWKFKITQGDMATVQSGFYLVKNGKVVFSSAIVLDKNSQGLQNSTYGWMQPVNKKAMINTCRSFRKVYWPVVIRVSILYRITKNRYLK